MHGMRHWMAAGLLGAVLTGGCVKGEHRGYDDEPEEQPRARRVALATAARPMTAADSAQAAARIAAEADSVRAAFLKGSKLKWREVFGLRRDKNAEQIARAQSLGVRASDEAEIERLRQGGKLVALGDSTEFWVLRKMEHSVPYVTPDARALLVRLGQRFHARLDSLGLPRYRMKVTSALRTNETQEELRKVNPNASQTVSAHEFGTTVDVSHERFAVPAEPEPGDEGAAQAALDVREMEMEMLEELGKENAKVLQAELGRALAELREEGAVMVMMEDRQPVYHFTVARRISGAGEDSSPAPEAVEEAKETAARLRTSARGLAPRRAAP